MALHNDGGFELGCIIPAYWPSTDTRTWTDLIQTKRTYPNVDMMVVLPEVAALSVIHSRPDADSWRSLVTQLNKADIVTLGRMDTNFASVQIHELQPIAHTWQSAFGTGDHEIDGIFFDNMSNQVSDADFYRELYQYVRKNSQFSMAVGNVGRPMPKELLEDTKLPDVFIIKDSAGYDVVDSKYLQYQNVSNRLLGVLVHSAPFLDRAWLAQVTQYVNWVYVSSGSGSYNAGLPNYFIDLVVQLNTLQQTRD